MPKRCVVVVVVVVVVVIVVVVDAVCACVPLTHLIRVWRFLIIAPR